MSDSAHPPSRTEAACRRCGRCCVQKVIVNGEVFATTRPCRYLDPKSKLCTVYERRFEVNADCLSVPDGIRHHVFPADCPYVQGLQDYRPPRPEVLSERVLAMLANGEIGSLEELLAATRRYPVVRKEPCSREHCC